jgi:hypothetical protein
MRKDTSQLNGELHRRVTDLNIGAFNTEVEDGVTHHDLIESIAQDLRRAQLLRRCPSDVIIGRHVEIVNRGGQEVVSGLRDQRGNLQYGPVIAVHGSICQTNINIDIMCFEF